MLIGVTCPRLRPGKAAKVDLTKRSYGVHVLYYCLDGFWFQSKKKSLELVCQDDGTWSSDLPECISKFLRCNRKSLFEHTSHAGTVT